MKAMPGGPLKERRSGIGSKMTLGGTHKAQKDGDPALESLFAQPFNLILPAQQLVPFVFASPHSGRIYPPGFVAASRLNAVTLRRLEDAFVDQLFSAATALGAPMIAARFPRAYLD